MAFTDCHLQDNLGNNIHLVSPAKRIVSLSPDLTEILFAIGAGKQVVGVGENSDYPHTAQHLPRVGNYRSLDIEKILALKPDLIVTWGAGWIKEFAFLSQQGLPIYHYVPQQLKDVSQAMRQLGCLTGHKSQANLSAEQYDKKMASLKRRYAQLKPIRVFFQIGPYPQYTVNRSSWIDQALTYCGGINVYHEDIFVSPRVNWETILVKNPAIVISDAGEKIKWQAAWQAYPAVSAVKSQQFYVIPADLIERAGPRLTSGVSHLCQLIAKARA